MVSFFEDYLRNKQSSKEKDHSHFRYFEFLGSAKQDSNSLLPERMELLISLSKMRKKRSIYDFKILFFLRYH